MTGAAVLEGQANVQAATGNGKSFLQWTCWTRKKKLELIAQASSRQP